ncbi:MAG: hypothetical protein MUF21_11825, partial [Gemmatimonadaceae bacterium]|nr:hypothetical protein [Gemmatimonadaceae bacterium]
MTAADTRALAVPAIAMPALAPRHVYVHVPFCARRCSYCDFAIAVRRTVPWRDFVDGIARELATRAPTGDGAASPTQSIDTLYLGGGTP